MLDNKSLSKENSPRRKHGKHLSEGILQTTGSAIKARSRINSDPIRKKETEEGSVKDTFVAQLMSGWRDPNTLAKETKPYYSREDYYIIAHAFFGAITPKTFFKQLSDVYQSEDNEGKEICIANAEIFIKNLIHADLENVFLNRIQKYINIFFDGLKVEENQPYASVLERLQQEIALAKQRKADADEMMAVVPEVLNRRFSLTTYLREDLQNYDKFVVFKSKKMNKKAKEFAADLKELQIDLMRKIKLSEFHNDNFMKFYKGTGPKLTVNRCADLFNRLAERVVAEILLARSKKHQQRIYDFFVETLYQSIEMDDYQSAISILSGLNHRDISRLGFLNTKRKDQIENLFEPNHNFKNLRAHLETRLKDEETELVPGLNILQKDLTFTADGNSAFTVNENEELKNPKENEDRMQLAGREAEKFLRYQRRYLSRPSKPFTTDIRAWMRGLCLSDDLSYFLSNSILPVQSKDKPTFDSKKNAEKVCRYIIWLRNLREEYQELKVKYDNAQEQERKVVLLKLKECKENVELCQAGLLKRSKALLAVLEEDKEAPLQLKGKELSEHDRLAMADDYLFAGFHFAEIEEKEKEKEKEEEMCKGKEKTKDRTKGKVLDDISLSFRNLRLHKLPTKSKTFDALGFTSQPKTDRSRAANKAEPTMPSSSRSEVDLFKTYQKPKGL